MEFAPEPTDEQIEESMDMANSLTDDLLEMLDDAEPDIDPCGVVYSLWVNLTHMLAYMGWNPEELTKDLHHHMAEQTTDGHA